LYCFLSLSEKPEPQHSLGRFRTEEKRREEKAAEEKEEERRRRKASSLTCGGGSTRTESAALESFYSRRLRCARHPCACCWWTSRKRHCLPTGFLAAASLFIYVCRLAFCCAYDGRVFYRLWLGIMRLFVTGSSSVYLCRPALVLLIRASGGADATQHGRACRCSRRRDSCPLLRANAIAWYLKRDRACVLRATAMACCAGLHAILCGIVS